MQFIAYMVKELGPGDSDAFAVAESKLNKVVSQQGKCWMTVVKFDEVFDDGPFGTSPSNFTPWDRLAFKAFVEDDDGGASTDFAINTVYNVAPEFVEYPSLDVTLGTDGVTVLAARLIGSFSDIGTKDWHKIEIALPAAFFPLGPIWLPPGENDFSVNIPLPGAREIEDFGKLSVVLSDDDLANIAFNLEVVSITTKSFINGAINDGFGAFPVGDNHDAATNANLRLATFAGLTALAFQEDPQTPYRYVGQTGESYRLYSRVNLSFGWQ